MLIGTAMAATMVLLNKATVLYTFYAPLKAHVIFYIGMALVVVSSWISAIWTDYALCTMEKGT